MKILQFLNNTGSHIGGIEQCAINYSKALLLDNKNYVYTILPDKNICYKSKIGGEVFEVNIKNKIRLFLSIIRIINNVRPNILILHCSRGLKLFSFLSFFYKFKIIGVNHGFNLKKFTKYANIIFCINKTQIKETKNKIKNPKIKIIYFPNVTEVRHNIERRELGKTVIIGTLSRIDFKYKNLDKIVLAAKIMKDKKVDFNFHIGGDFGEIKKLKQMVLDFNLSDKFIFKGFIDNKEKFFEEIDIFCMPSNEETFGLSYIEAMAHKVPVIATNNSGAMDIFKNKENGILIDKNDKKNLPHSIANSIELLINNKDIYKQISQNALKTINNEFSLESLNKKIKLLM